jgi:hypothetical protein
MDFAQATWITYFAIGAIILLCTFLAWKFLSVNNTVVGIFGTIGLIACVFGLVVYTGALASTQIVEEETPEWDISATLDADETWNTLYSDENMIQMAVSFNDTSDAFVSNTQYLEANFTILRADAGSENAKCLCQLGISGVPLIDVSGAADEYILDEVSTGEFDWEWTKEGATTGVYEQVYVVVEEVGDSWVVLNITLNAAALVSMDTYETAEIDFTIGGESWTIEVVKAVVTT